MRKIRLNKYKDIKDWDQNKTKIRGIDLKEQ